MGESGAVTRAEVEAFVARCQTLVNEQYEVRFPTLRPPMLETMYGRKFVRIVSVVQGDQRSAWAFVDLETGDVLKSDGWKRPAAHPRGNIRDEHQGMKYISMYGPAYLK